MFQDGSHENILSPTTLAHLCFRKPEQRVDRGSGALQAVRHGRQPTRDRPASPPRRGSMCCTRMTPLSNASWPNAAYNTNPEGLTTLPRRFSLRFQHLLTRPAGKCDKHRLQTGTGSPFGSARRTLQTENLSESRQDIATSMRFPSNGFTYYLTLFSKFFSSFPHGTCSLSVSCPYSALDGVYHPLWAAFPNNPTRRKRIVDSARHRTRDCHPLRCAVPSNLGTARPS